MKTKTTRLTSQKLKIMQHLMSVKTHPTADQVYAAVKKDLPAISLATVYRNLNQLAAQGKILKLEIGGEFHFDGDICGHQHCVCRECGRIMDTFQKDISDYAMHHIKAKGFQPECVSVIFKGLCSACR
jgi:Fe2+ or Zn2+ uptake regulation protein